MLRCTKCSGTEIEFFKVLFTNNDWHCKGVCKGCGRCRYVDKKTFYRDDLPVAELKKKRKKNITDL